MATGRIKPSRVENETAALPRGGAAHRKVLRYLQQHFAVRYLQQAPSA